MMFNMVLLGTWGCAESQPLPPQSSPQQGELPMKVIYKVDALMVM
jgi:hypothetical protein